MLAIYKDGACTNALIMDITTNLVKLYQLKVYNNYFKVCQPCAAFNPFSEQSREITTDMVVGSRDWGESPLCGPRLQCCFASLACGV